MNRLVVEIRNMRWVALAGGSPLVEGGCWDHTGYPALDIARMASKNRGLEDVEYHLNLVLWEGGGDKAPASLELAVCDPNDHNEDHLTRLAGVIVVAAHLVSLIAMAPGSDHWR
jgi:hypothetical protein